MKKTLALLLVVLFSTISFSQQNAIKIKATLNNLESELLIQQEIVYINHSDTTLTQLYLHNWANSFRDRNTPLSKRFIKDYNKNLYFAPAHKLGFTSIKNLTVDFENSEFNEVKNQADILKINLKKPLHQNKSTKINITYTVKIPSAEFTGYGKTKDGYHLRFWYITPAVYKKDGN